MEERDSHQYGLIPLLDLDVPDFDLERVRDHVEMGSDSGFRNSGGAARVLEQGDVGWL